MTRRDSSSFALGYAAVVVCGMLNNLPYCIISGAGQDLARQFHAQNQATLLTTSMNLSALLATFISARYMLRFQFYSRVKLVLFMSLLAYAGLAVATAGQLPYGFAMAALFSTFSGMAQIFGETTNLAFLKYFPKEFIGGWGAGTGIAGIAGSGVYIILRHTLHLSNADVFLLMLPTLLLYWAAFYYLHTQAIKYRDGPDLAARLGGTISRENLIQPIQNNQAGGQSMCAAMRYSGDIMFSMVAVYCLEYFIYPGLDDRETLCAQSRAWYTVMWLCYNVGVTLSRFSVSVFRIRRVWLLTLFQLVNVIGWTLEVYLGLIRNSLPEDHGLLIMSGWMVAVGLCGGATYGNCMYLFNKKEGIPDELRELGINLGFVMSNIGITLASMSFLLLDASIMRKSLLYPRALHPDCYD
mmetsp:Transcript_26234/g.57702  ORF Transcript_26234/g.57702 Transcript_26234/m.57702 type:complete len:411 (-) Transcript_26234:50-1282(-)